MADVNISKYRASVVRDGSKPASPGFVVSEGQDPVNPPGTNNFVPYTGATANVELGEFGLETGFVTLDTTPTNIPTDQGAIYWDDAKSTAALIMNGTLQHIGQDTFFYVKNSSGSSIPKGTAVRFAGTDGASGHLLIEPFLANGTYPSSYFMGVTAETIANGSFGQVMHFGELNGIDTSGYTAGALLYASTTVAGGFQTTAPVAPNNIVLIAAAVNSKNNGEIIVRPQIGSNINNDEGVKITSGATGDLLQLQAGGLWENKTLAQVIGSAYVPSTRTITINGTTQDLSANRSWTVGDVRTDGSYSNPSWITALAWSKISGTPTTLSGYGITNAYTKTEVDSFLSGKQNTLTLTTTGTSGAATLVGSTLNIPIYSPDLSGYVPTSRTITINGTTQDLSANRTFNVGTVTSVGLSSATSGVTIGSTPVTSSGTITLAIATASGSQNGLLSSTDWTTFNNKQNALTNPVTGTGTTNYLAKFTGSTTIGNSQVFDNGTNVGIGTASPTEKLDVIGVFRNLMPSDPLSGMITAKILSYSPSPYGIHFRGYDSGVHSIQVQREGNNSQLFGLSLQPLGGNLLVGTTTDNGARLQVSGAAHISSSTNGYLTLNAAASGGNEAGIFYAVGGSNKWEQYTANNDSRMVWYSYAATSIVMSLTTTGAATFSSSVTANGLNALGSTLNNGNAIRLYRAGLVEMAYIGWSNENANNSTWLFKSSNGNPIAFSADGVNQQLVITTGGNVGIGVTSPLTRLMVQDSANTYVAHFSGLNQANGIAIGTNSSNVAVIQGYTRTFSATNNIAMQVDGGNVGIGTTNPLQKFHITQASDTAYPTLGTGKGALFIAGDTNLYGLYVGINTLDGNTYFQAMRNNSATAYNITMQAAGGNLLIGTTTDVGAKLHVNGDVRTAAPSGGSAVNWKLGTVRGGTVTPNATVRVEIGGVLVDLDARYV